MWETRLSALSCNAKGHASLLVEWCVNNAVVLYGKVLLKEI